MDRDKIRKLYIEGKVKWTVHGLERMQEKDISMDDIENCIMNGEEIEDYPDDYPCPSCLIFGYDKNDCVIHTVVGANDNELYIITSYRPSTEIFEANLKTRKVRKV